MARLSAGRRSALRSPARIPSFLRDNMLPDLSQTMFVARRNLRSRRKGLTEAVRRVQMLRRYLHLHEIDTDTKCPPLPCPPSEQLSVAEGCCKFCPVEGPELVEELVTYWSFADGTGCLIPLVTLVVMTKRSTVI
ncbi:hypothetical protein DBV15_03049 [Temnothorax longispinosus]|uniref:Uncharacterized protein n=1 Tax=Temnothorax longispinosus TaxID=300112 RepID=A0A4S2KHB7_9HYME|nr:hypothetical protein DBV15_03049 [Temnothorax longispinosus]